MPTSPSHGWWRAPPPGRCSNRARVERLSSPPRRAGYWAIRPAIRPIARRSRRSTASPRRWAASWARLALRSMRWDRRCSARRSLHGCTRTPTAPARCARAFSPAYLRAGWVSRPTSPDRCFSSPRRRRTSTPGTSSTPTAGIRRGSVVMPMMMTSPYDGPQQRGVAEFERGRAAVTPSPQSKSAFADFDHFIEWPKPAYTRFRLGEGWGGGSGGYGAAVPRTSTPTPNPSPQGGGEEIAAPLRQKPAPTEAQAYVGISGRTFVPLDEIAKGGIMADG